MKSTSIVFVLAAGLTLSACKSQPEQNNSPSGQETAQENELDSLYKDVVAVHDEVMPKMGKIIGYKKAIQARIDSLDVVIKSNKTQAAIFNQKVYKRLLVQLNEAEKGMNDWMEQFDWEKKLSKTQDDMSLYYEEQKQAATKMKTDLLIAIDSAAAKF